jgi:hypothetical protein
MIYQQYLKKLVLFLIIFAFPLGGNWMFLYNSGELLPIEEIVDKQLASEKYCVVGLATRNQGYYYKKTMYEKVKPDVLVLGSSRVMQFRQGFFSASMVNAGGAMSSINEGFSYVKDAFSIHRPKLIILGLDYWWFNENALPPTTQIKPPLPLSHHISLRSYLLPYKWLWQKKITVSQYVERVNPFFLLPHGFNNGIGVDGGINQNGFAKDGSYVYSKTITGKEKNIDDKFELSFDSIEHNGPRFEYGKHVNNTHFNNFIHMVKFIQQHNVKVVLFIPPLAPSVAKKMDGFKNEYLFIEELRDRIKAAGLTYQDFHHPSQIATNDCEFIDGIHGGDVTYARILSFLAEQNAPLKSYINTATLDNITKYYNNIAMVPHKSISSHEVDFLHLGCDKSTQYALAAQHFQHF